MSVIAAALLISIDRPKLTREGLKQLLMESYGISGEEFEKLSLEMPGGWHVPLEAIRLPAKHNHPLPANYSVVDTGATMVFAHLADGTIPGTDRFYQTTFFLVNDSNQDASGTIEFYDDLGNPLEITMGGVTGSRFPFALKHSEESGEVKRFVTSGTGGIKSGWAHVHSDQPISGTSSFAIKNPAGKVFIDVGVGESSLGTRFTLFADTIGPTTSGVAVVNPSDSETVPLHLELLRTSGAVAAARDRVLNPRAHLALFLHELFADVANINEFEGSLVITSARQFAGLTLRVVGDQLTSLPMVPPPGQSKRIKLALPQVADGRVGSLVYATTILLFDNTTEPATGKVEFFQGDGKPMSLTIGGRTASSFDFSLNPKGVLRLLTSGTGTAKVGWARVTMDKPLSASAIFHTFDPSGNLLNEVGINAGPLRKDFTLIADTIGFANTGIAVANPSEVAGDTIDVRLLLYDKNGKYLTSSDLVTFEPLQQKALFLTELIPNSRFADIDEFEGLVKVFTNDAVAPLALRQIDDKLTSTPVLSTLHGFAPTSQIEFAQNLAGTSVPVRWRLHQNEDDFGLETVKISAPDLGLRADQINVLDTIAWGYFAQGTSSRVFEFVATKKGSLEFDAITVKNSGNFPLGKGKFDGTPSGGLTIEFALAQNTPASFVAGDVDLNFFLLGDFIVAPGSAKSATIATELTSVPIRNNEDARVVRKVSEAVVFAAPDAVKANLVAISPRFPGPGTVVTLAGTNFGSSPLVVFPTQSGVLTQIAPLKNEAGNLEVITPDTLVEGPIQVDNGSGAGNAYKAKVLFAPAFQMQPASTTGGTETGFSIKFNQAAEQFALDSFQVITYGVDRVLSGLAIGAVVGGGKFVERNFPVEFELKVESSAAAKAVLAVVQKGYSDTTGKMTVEKVTEDPGGLRFSYTPSRVVVEPILLDLPLTFEFSFTAFPIKLPSAGKVVLSVGSVISAPKGSGSTLQVAQPSLFRTQ